MFSLSVSVQPLFKAVQMYQRFLFLTEYELKQALEEAYRQRKKETTQTCSKTVSNQILAQTQEELML